MHLNTRGKAGTEIVNAINSSLQETGTAIYDEKTARWFSSTYGDKLLNPQTFNIDEGFNVLVFVPRE